MTDQSAFVSDPGPPQSTLRRPPIHPMCTARWRWMSGSASFRRASAACRSTHRPHRQPAPHRGRCRDHRHRRLQQPVVHCRDRHRRLAQITLPSLQALGVTDLRASTAPTSTRSWRPTASTPTATATRNSAPRRRFCAPSPTEACGRPQGDQKVFATATATAAPPVNGNGHAPAGDDAERQVALQFLPAIVKTCVEGNGVNSAKLDLALKSIPFWRATSTWPRRKFAQAMSQALAEPAF